MRAFSVIIPTYNEENTIAQCLDSILKSAKDYSDYEIIIVDGNSTDETLNIIQDYAKIHRHIRILNNPQKIVPISMNMGISQAQSDLVFRIDGHAYVDQQFFRETLIAADAHPEAALVGGNIHSLSHNLKGKAIALAQSSPFGVGNASFRTGGKDCYVDTLAFGVYRRQALDQVGGFDENFVRNQDDELSYRLIQAGYKIFKTDKIKSSYFTRDEFGKLWNQYKQYGYWKVKGIRKHKKPAAIRHLIPVCFVISLFLSIPLSFFNYNNLPLSLYWLGLILIPYTLLCTLFSCKLSLKHGIKLLPLLIICFPILHLSYGWGFLVSLLTSSKVTTQQNGNRNYVQTSR